MTTTTHTEDEGTTALTPAPGPEGSGIPGISTPEVGGTRVDVPLGRRVMVVSDLLLTPLATS